MIRKESRSHGGGRGEGGDFWWTSPAVVQGFGCSSGVGTNSVTNTLRGFATPVGRSPRGCVDTLVRYCCLLPYSQHDERFGFCRAGVSSTGRLEGTASSWLAVQSNNCFIECTFLSLSLSVCLSVITYSTQSTFSRPKLPHHYSFSSTVIHASLVSRVSVGFCQLCAGC